MFTKDTNEEPAVLPGVLIILQEPITKETESDAKGAFAVDVFGLLGELGVWQYFNPGARKPYSESEILDLRAAGGIDIAPERRS